MIVLLKEKFGAENVALEERSSRAIETLRRKRGEKVVVLLDFDLGHGEPHAPEVLMAIREFTSLIYVIVVTAKQFSDIAPEDLVKFVNNDAFAIIQNTDDIDEIIDLTVKAAHSMDTRIDSVLEQWISNRSEEEAKRPYLSTPDGKSYSLSELQNEIRHQSPIGKDLEKSILHLAIELLAKEGKTK
ncbi:hypothetical protein [Haloferula sp.]|uniref:hypothetical protein n=1 Tax=Haloferula sp. TaxID=2497595 RepID=UPI0032A0DAD3